jgi:hypothetical protein
LVSLTGLLDKMVVNCTSDTESLRLFYSWKMSFLSLWSLFTQLFQGSFSLTRFGQPLRNFSCIIVIRITKRKVSFTSKQSILSHQTRIILTFYRKSRFKSKRFYGFILLVCLKLILMTLSGKKTREMNSITMKLFKN